MFDLNAALLYLSFVGLCYAVVCLVQTKEEKEVVELKYEEINNE